MATKKGPPKADRHDNPEDLEQLSKLIRSLYEEPPKNRVDLRHRYHDITGLISKIEADKGNDQEKIILARMEPEFVRICKTYRRISPEVIKERSNSLFADQYRFFVSGLEIYLKRVAGVI